MTSVSPHIKTIPSEGAYYISVASLDNKVFNYDPTRGGALAFSTATWANPGNANYQGQIGAAGTAILRDLGKTVVSSLRTFRKVQLVTSSLSSGTAVGAPVGSQNGPQATPVVGEEYFSGYIEVVGAYGRGSVNSATLAPVARLG
jgi:hypothetical protein